MAKTTNKTYARFAAGLTLLLVFCVSFSQPLPLANARGVSFDAETHPWKIDPGSGFVPYNPAAVHAFDKFKVIANLIAKRTSGHDFQMGIADGIKALGDIARTPGFRQSDLISQVAAHAQAELRKIQDPTAPLPPDFVIDLLDQVAWLMLQDARTKLAKESFFHAIQLGADSESGDIFGYANAVLGFPETYSRKLQSNDRGAFFLTGSSSFRGNAPTTFRGGLGFAAGDPDHLLATASVARYTNVWVNDIDARASMRLSKNSQRIFDSRMVMSLSEEELSQRLNEERHLLDHVRKGDLWGDLGFRVISGDHSGFETNVYEAALTWATNNGLQSSRYVNLVTTLCLSAAYCPKHNVGLNEVGIEVRHPLLLATNLPTYLTLRAGSNRDYSAGLLFRF